jgi:hypothetical protein
MNPLRWLSALLLALALAAGASLWLQRQAAAALRDEIMLLREENRELARLRAERQRLLTAQVPVAELERLRADRAAIVRLRDEIEKLKARTDDKARSVAQATAPLIPAGEWKNAGRMTPHDTVETLLWAGTRRDVDTIAGAISFEAVAGRQAQAMFALLPEALRSQHGSVERFVASMMAKEPPALAARVIEEKLTADRMLVAIRVQNQDGREKIARYTMKRADDGWRMEVPLAVVHGIAKQMGVALQALN